MVFIKCKTNPLVMVKFCCRVSLHSPTNNLGLCTDISLYKSTLTRQHGKKFILAFWQHSKGFNINYPKLIKSAGGCISYFQLTGKSSGQCWLKIRCLKHAGGLVDYKHDVWLLRPWFNTGRDLCCFLLTLVMFQIKPIKAKNSCRKTNSRHSLEYSENTFVSLKV